MKEEWIGGDCGTHVREKVACRVLVPKLEGQKPLARHRCRWEDNIKMNIEEILCKGMNWILKAHDTDK
jgi:hypothetical protein